MKEIVSSDILFEQYSKPRNYIYYNCTKNIYKNYIGSIWNSEDTIGHLHIQKTAGNSIATMAGYYCCDNEYTPFCSKFKTRAPTDENCKSLASKCNFHPHLTELYDCLSNQKYDPIIFIGIFRNPIDRMISEFYHLNSSASLIHSLWDIPNEIMVKMAKNEMPIEEFMLLPDLFTNRQSRVLLDSVWEYNKGRFEFQNTYFNGSNLDLENDLNTNPIYIKMLEEIINSQFLWVGTTDNNLWNNSIALFNKKFNVALDIIPKRNLKSPEDPNEVSQKVRDIIAKRNVLDMKLMELIYERIEKEIKLLLL